VSSNKKGGTGGTTRGRKFSNSGKSVLFRFSGKPFVGRREETSGAKNHCQGAPVNGRGPPAGQSLYKKPDSIKKMKRGEGGKVTYVRGRPSGKRGGWESQPVSVLRKDSRSKKGGATGPIEKKKKTADEKGGKEPIWNCIQTAKKLLTKKPSSGKGE